MSVTVKCRLPGPLQLMHVYSGQLKNVRILHIEVTITVALLENNPRIKYGRGEQRRRESLKEPLAINDLCNVSVCQNSSESS